MNARGLASQRGATLIEMVMVIVLLAVAATAIMDQFTTSARSYRINESIQTAAQLAQECAEHILAARRLQGYATAITVNCPTLPAVYTAAGYARTRTFDAAPAACFAPPDCREVTVTVTQDGVTRASVVLMLGSY